MIRYCLIMLCGFTFVFDFPCVLLYSHFPRQVLSRSRFPFLFLFAFVFLFPFPVTALSFRLHVAQNGRYQWRSYVKKALITRVCFRLLSKYMFVVIIVCQVDFYEYNVLSMFITSVILCCKQIYLISPIFDLFFK